MSKYKLRGWLVPAVGECRVIEIDNTLEALQAAVGGYIETVRLAPDLIGIVNEEGRILGLARNTHFSGIVGDMLVVGEDGEEFRSLSDMEIGILRRFMS